MSRTIRIAGILAIVAITTAYLFWIDPTSDPLGVSGYSRYRDINTPVYVINVTNYGRAHVTVSDISVVGVAPPTDTTVLTLLGSVPNASTIRTEQIVHTQPVTGWRLPPELKETSLTTGVVLRWPAGTDLTQLAEVTIHYRYFGWPKKLTYEPKPT